MGDQAPPSGGPSGALEDVIVDGAIDQSRVGAALGRQIDAPNSAVMAIAVAAFRDAEASRALLREQLERVASEKEALFVRYHEESKNSAILSTQLKASSRFRKLQQPVFAIGSMLLALGAGDAVRTATISGMDAVLAVAGVLVMMLGSPLFSIEK